MNTFIEVPATQNSINRRKLVLGVGINDAPYMTSFTKNGKTKRCSIYRSWHNMLIRCYCPKYQSKNPSYKGSSVCSEWLHFTGFYKWMITQDCGGKSLDKDILKLENKIYSPETCCFVSQQINKLVMRCRSDCGRFPTGVSRNDSRGKGFQAGIGVNGKGKNLGHFYTIEEAKSAYNKAKAQVIYEAAMKQPERIKAGLLRHRDLYLA